MLAVSTLFITGLLLVMSLSVCRADSLEINSNDLNEIYVFIVVAFGIIVSFILLFLYTPTCYERPRASKNPPAK
jgi:hypothetical protein